ncbi:hypothetical protein [Pseudomonas pharyngis]|uniref:hypothetical protein n=1 Tax=Pseudomonas pharyngis TaxID=2892333 RepID=UPI001F304303|nr:hypothetical protein [Pseudomonas pharyngis]
MNQPALLQGVLSVLQEYAAEYPIALRIQLVEELIEAIGTRQSPQPVPTGRKAWQKQEVKEERPAWALPHYAY